MENLTHTVVTKRLKVDGTNYIGAAGVTTLTSEPVDTANAEGVRFVVGYGVIVATGVNSSKVRQGQAANMSDGADLAGSGTTGLPVADAGKIVITEIFRPQERYVDHVCVRTVANTTIDFLIAELYVKRVEPVVQDSFVYSNAGGPKVLNSPAEGTA
jgi:hypothetical protein